MSVIECRDCKKKISSNANNCPHCGYTYKDGSTTIKKIALVFGILLLIIPAINLIRFLMEYLNSH